MRVLSFTTALLAAVASAAPSPAPVEERAVEERSPATGGTRKQSSEEYTHREKTDARDAGSTTKYFHEPGSDDILGHYDSRYFKEVVDYDVRTDTLHHLMRSYLLFFREKGLETWIAHGTLLGWWWNGQILPWDWDIDTQVSGETLAYMAAHLNRTTYHYSSDSYTSSTHIARGEVVQRDYLLDVNPWSWQRSRGDGMNIIDARWIDLRNGLYIDITGLSELSPGEEPGIWTCKNKHRYRTRDLYPMRESVYEGVPAKIPYAYDKILLEEYREKALVLTEYEGHVWNEQQRLWVKKTKKVEKTLAREPEPKNNPKKRTWMQEVWHKGA